MRGAPCVREGRQAPRSVTGILLAAGGARRFGSPKQLALLDGRPLVAHAYAALTAILDDVVVVVGHAGEEVAAAMPRARVVHAADWEEGLAASLRAGIAATDADAAAIHLADLPGVTPAAIANVLAAFDGTLPVRAHFDGAPGHPVVLPRSRFAAVAGLRGDAGMRALLLDADAVECSHLGDGADVDRPADLAALRR